MNTDDMDKKRAEIAMRNTYEWQDRRDYDPFRNPCTPKIIDSSRRIRKRVSVAQPLIPDLPLEILFEILDFLDCKDASRAGIAFRVVIPDCYWRSRAALILIEFDEIAEEDLDWQYLCVKYEAVYATDERFGFPPLYTRFIEQQNGTNISPKPWAKRLSAFGESNRRLYRDSRVAKS